MGYTVFAWAWPGRCRETRVGRYFFKGNRRRFLPPEPAMCTGYHRRRTPPSSLEPIACPHHFWVRALGDSPFFPGGLLSFSVEPLDFVRSWNFQGMYLRLSDKAGFRYRSSTGNRSLTEPTMHSSRPPWNEVPAGDPDEAIKLER